MVEFIFRKTAYFQHILTNKFRRMCLKYENFSLKGISHISDIQTTFRLKMSCYKNCQWKYIKTENNKCYLDNKKQEAMFLVVSWSDAHFGFGACILCAGSAVQVKLRPKNWVRWSKFVQAYLKWLFLKMWQFSQGNVFDGNSLWKRDANTGVFLWILHYSLCLLFFNTFHFPI